MSKRKFHSKIHKVRPKIGQNTCGLTKQHQVIISYEIAQAFGRCCFDCLTLGIQLLTKDFSRRKLEMK